MQQPRRRRVRAGLSPLLGCWALIGALPILVAACNRPVTTPPEQAVSYYGDWTAPSVVLRITPKRVVYTDHTSFFPTLVEMDFLGLAGHDIVGGSKKKMYLSVGAPPHQEGGVWKMTVEGHPLARQ